MLFKNKKCSKCGHLYEEVLDECPFCSTPNKQCGELGIPKKLIMLPWLNQGLLFIIGLVGLVILQILFSSIFGQAFGETSLLAVLLANVVPYFCVVLMLIGSVVLYRKKFFNSFKKPYDFLIGLGFGLILLLLSLLYSNVFLKLFDIGVNNNQKTFESLVASYPVFCLIIFGFVAPLVEEMTYRVGLFSLLYRVNKYVAFVAVIIIFGLIHFDFTGDMKIELLNLPNYLMAGLLFCLAYRFGGLPACLTAHTLNNVVSIVATIIMLKNGQ